MILFLAGLGGVFAVPARAAEVQQGETAQLGDETAKEGQETPPLPFSLEGPIDPQTYVLGPSDQLLLILRGGATTVYPLRVLPEGNVILPNLGPYPASGLTLMEFRNSIRKKLSAFYRQVEIECQLSVPRTFLMFVLGEVRRPGPVELRAPFRLSHAVAAAGGVADIGSARRIEIRENGAVVRTVDLFAFLRRGDFEENPMLKEGQSVFVPVKRSVVSVIGEVPHAGTYELLLGETVRDIIEFAGGISSTGDRERILLERVGDAASDPTHTFAYEAAGDVVLRDMDAIIVRDVMSFDDVKPVQVFGGGGRVGAIELRAPEPLRDFLTRLWRFKTKYNTETALIERASDGEQTTFNVAAVLSGDPAGQALVSPGDIISFAPQEMNVYVAGHVEQAGPIPFQPGYTAERYIALAGGPKESGSFDKLTVYSRDGVKRKANRTSLIYRGETIEVGRRTSKLFGSVFLAVTSATSVILSIIAVSSR